ncbi:MAG: hypothetical protein ABIJ41_04090 [Candidatus Omnitrophota bacterium]
MMLRAIYKELRHHAPFTFFGALTGILFMILFRNIPEQISFKLFYTFHPAHVVLSALVTTSMYSFYKCDGIGRKCNLWFLLAIGYVGSIGIATFSDSLIPYWGEILLKMHHSEPHIGFIEMWWLVNPAAMIGIAIAYFKPSTKFPHAGHVLLSTWASLFHIMMAGHMHLSWYSYLAVFAFLFVAVWLPCCISDIVFPLLFVKEKGHKNSCSCH